MRILLQHPGIPLVALLIREGVTHGEPLSIVIYRITLIPLEEKIRATDPGRLTPFYTNDAAFGRLERGGAKLMKMLLEQGPDQGYFPGMVKYLFIVYFSSQESVAMR